MNNSVIILGAGGRFGRAATQAFLKRGWHVSVLVRGPKLYPTSDEVTQVKGNVYDTESLAQAIKGHLIIVNALNPPYTDWERDVPRITSNVIASALACSATVMIPGNIYNYGESMPERLLESTPQAALTKKGKIRVQMEQEYRLAAKSGLRTIILRAGDFIEKKQTGNWFDSHVIKHINKGVFTYPGALNQRHAWAFLPDLAEAMAQLAEKRAQFSSYEEFGFEGFNITGKELKIEIEAQLGRTLTQKRVPWAMMKAIAIFSPMIKEVIELRYLWEVAHQIDGAKLKQVLPEFKPHSVKMALKSLL